MGIKFFSTFFKRANIIGISGPILDMSIDASCLWHSAFHYLKSDFTPELFVNFFFENAFCLELENPDNIMSLEMQETYGVKRQKISLVFDNKYARNFEKWPECIDRCNVFYKVCPEFNIEKIASIFESEAENRNLHNFEFCVVEAKFDTDRHIRRHVQGLFEDLKEKNLPIPMRSYFYNEDGEETCIDASAIVVVTNDSDFYSYFPLCERACIFSQLHYKSKTIGDHSHLFSRLANFGVQRKGNEFVEMIMDFAEKNSNGDKGLYIFFCESLFSFLGMTSVNDFITCDFKNKNVLFLVFRVFEVQFRNFFKSISEAVLYSEPRSWLRSDTDAGRLDLRFFFTYFSTWILTVVPNSFRKVFQNTLRWFCFESLVNDGNGNYNFSVFKFAKDKKDTEPCSRSVVNLKSLTEMVNEKFVFLKNHQEKFLRMEKEFKSILEKNKEGYNGSLSKINVTNVLSDVFAKKKILAPEAAQRKRAKTSTTMSEECGGEEDFTPSQSQGTLKRKNMWISSGANLKSVGNTVEKDVESFVNSMAPLVIIFYSQLVFLWCDYIWVELPEEFFLFEKNVFKALEDAFHVTINDKTRVLEETNDVIKFLITNK